MGLLKLIILQLSIKDRCDFFKSTSLRSLRQKSNLFGRKLAYSFAFEPHLGLPQGYVASYIKKIEQSLVLKDLNFA